jgi:hypothetical protein
MADITMCHGDMCPKKDTCHRYTAPKNEYRQSFFITIPMNKDETCDEYLDNKDWIKQ